MKIKRVFPNVTTTGATVAVTSFEARLLCRNVKSAKCLQKWTVLLEERGGVNKQNWHLFIYLISSMIIKIRIFKRKESLFPFWYFLENYEQRTGFVRLSNTRTWYRPQSSADCGECTKPPLWAISSLKREALKNFTFCAFHCSWAQGCCQLWTESGTIRPSRRWRLCSVSVLTASLTKCRSRETSLM